MRGTPVRNVDFTGGLNTKAAPYLVASNECRDCLNVVTTTRGSVKKRPGISTFVNSGFNAAASQIQALFGAQGVPTAGTVLFAGDEDNRFYSITPGGVVTDLSFSTGTMLDTSIIQAPVQTGGAPTPQGPIYIINQATSQQWTGTGNIGAWTASIGTVPNGKYMVYFKNRVWIACTTANTSRLFFSDIGNPRSWPAGNVVDFDATDGNEITGIGTVGPYLLVFKPTKTWAVYDLDTGANRPLSASIGCPAHRSIVESPKGTFFLSLDKGVWVTDGKKLSQVSEKITPTLDAIVPAQRVRAAGGYLNDHYYLSICDSGSTNNKTLDYDTTTKSWWVHSNATNQFAGWRPSSEQQLYSGINIAARIDRVYDPTLFDDNGSNMLCRWTGPWLAFGEPYRNKRIRQVHVDGSGVVDAYKQVDYSAGISGSFIKSDIFNYPGIAPLSGGSDLFGGVGVYGGASTVGNRRLFSLGVARAFSFQIQATQNGLFEMDSYTAYITLRQN